MNPAESEYWDVQAEKAVNLQANAVVYDNINKRSEILKRLLKFVFTNASVLEIGIGNGVIGGVLKTIYNTRINYLGTDVSKTYVEFCKNKYGIEVAHAGITDLPYPDKAIHWIFAFDSLEHVCPDDRLKGYEEIGRVMADHSMIVLNIPVTPGHHDAMFDYGFDISDFVALLGVIKAKPVLYELYTVECGRDNIPIQYVWAIAERHL